MTTRMKYAIALLVVLSAWQRCNNEEFIIRSFYGQGDVVHRNLSLRANTNTTRADTCLSLDLEGQMDAILSDHRQLFITMPAKAAGSSMKAFAKKCLGTKKGEDTVGIELDSQIQGPEDDGLDNAIQRGAKKIKLLSATFKIPSIIVSHVYTAPPLIDLFKHQTRNSLIVHLHREESTRLLSGVKQVLGGTWVCNTEYANVFEEYNMTRNDTHCIIDEQKAIAMIGSRFYEISSGPADVLTCDLYDAVQENAPNFVVVHYKQIDALQKLIAKYHCPELLNELPIDANFGDAKRLGVYLRMSKGGDIVKLKDWLDAKKDVLEWVLDMKTQATCLGKTKQLEEELFRCPDETMVIVPSSVKHW